MTTPGSVREKLMITYKDELVWYLRNELGYDKNGESKYTNWGEVADFIIADRQRILAPLVEIKNKFEPDEWAYFAKSGNVEDKTISAIDSTLKAAGLS